MLYTELQVTTNFSFLRGASHPEEMVEAAHALGYAQLAITDRNSFAGIVRAHAAAKKIGLRIIVGAYLEVQDGFDVLVYAKTLQGYASICALLTEATSALKKGNVNSIKLIFFNTCRGLKSS
jgi:error-prone DNA polymerase